MAGFRIFLNDHVLGVGADADITVYRPDADLSRMFAMPAQVFKAGVLVAEDGELRSLPTGRVLAASLELKKENIRFA